MTDFANLVIRADSSQVRTATGDLTGMAGASGKVTGALRALAPALAGILSVRALGKMADEARQFGAAMGEVSTLLDDLDQLPRIEREAKKLTAAFGGTPTAQAKGFYQAISAGAANAEEATAILTQANKLAVGGVTDIGTAVDGLTSIVNAFGLEADQAGSVSDALFVAMRAGKTTVGELSSSVGKLAPIASSVGLSMEEMLGAVSALTTQGISTSESVNGLKAALANVLKPTKEAADEAERLGLNFGLAALQEQGFTGFMDSVVEKSGGSKESLVQLFGSVEALNTIFALTGGGAEAFADIMVDMGEKAGQTEIALSRVREQFDQQFSELTGKISVSREEVGELLIALASPLVGAANDNYQEITDTFGNLLTIVETLAAALITGLAVGFVAAQVEMLKYQAALARMAGVSVTAATATAAVTSVTGAFRGALALMGGPIGVAITALGLLALAYHNVRKAQDEAITDAVNYISGTGGLDSINLAVKETVDEIGFLEASIQSVGRSMRDPSDTQEFLRLKELQADKIEFLSRLITEQTILQDLATAEQEKATAAAKSAATSIGVLSMRVIELRKSKRDLLGVDLSLNVAAKEQAVVFGGELSDSVKELTASIDQQTADLGLNERALFLLNAERKLGTDAGWFEVQAVRASSAALFDKRESIRLTAEAEQQAAIDKTEAAREQATAEAEAAREQATAEADAARSLEREEDKALRQRERNNERAALAMQEDWRDTRDAFADFFVDFSNNGEDAFDSLAKAFESTLKRMIAQWLASGLMNVFNGDSFGANENTIFSPSGGGLGSLTNGNLAGMASGGGGLVAGVGQFGAGMFGTATGIAAGTVGPPTAAAASGAGLTAGLAAIPVWGWALLAAGASAAILNNDDGKVRQNAGFTVAPTPSLVGSDRAFVVDPFSSGLNVTGFARRADKNKAIEVIDTFRDVDLAFFDMIKTLGGNLDLSKATLAGLDQEANAGSDGTFFGLGGNGGLGGDIDAQINKFVFQLANSTEGLDATLLESIRTAKNSDEIFTLLAEEIKKLESTMAKTIPDLATVAPTLASVLATVDNSNEANLRRAFDIQKVTDAHDALSSIGLAHVSLGPYTGITTDIALELKDIYESGDIGRAREFALDNPLVARSVGFDPDIDGSLASGIDFVPFDGFRAELHKGERVQTRAEALADSSGTSDNGGMIYQALLSILNYLVKTFDIVDRWNNNGIPQERTAP